MLFSRSLTMLRTYCDWSLDWVTVRLAGMALPRRALRQDGVQLVDGHDQVLPRLLDHLQADHRLAVEPGVAQGVLEAVDHLGHVAQVDDVLAVLLLDDDAGDLLDALELAHDADRARGLVHHQVAAAAVGVLGADRVLDVVEAHLERFHFQRVDVDLDLALVQAADLDLGDLGDGLDLVLQVLGMLLQLVEAEIARQVDVDDGELVEIELDDHGVDAQVVGQLALALVHGVLDVLQGLFDLDVGVELDEDVGVVLRRDRAQLLDAADGVDLLFQRPGDQVLDVDRGVARRRRC